MSTTSAGCSAKRSSADLSRAGLVDLIPLVLEGQTHRGADPLVVLYEEDPVAHGCGFMGDWSPKVCRTSRQGPPGLPEDDQVDFQIWGVQIVPTIMP